MGFSKLNYKVKNGIAIVQMNCLKNLNAVDEKMASDLIDAMKEAESDPDVKVVVLSSAAKSFSAGGDIGFFNDQLKAGQDMDLSTLFYLVGVLADYMKKMSKPIISSVNGAAAGAGVGLALGADFMICVDNAKFILAFVNLGLVPNTGSTYLLAKNIGVNRTMEIVSSGRPFSAQEAKDLGLACKVVPAECLEKETMIYAERLASGPLKSYKNIKKQIYNAVFDEYREWLSDIELPTQQECSVTQDFKEGCMAFAEKRAAKFSGN